MINSIGNSTVNPIQMFNAVNAFKASGKTEQSSNINEPSDGINLTDNSILKNQNVDEIKNVAKIVGENNLSNDDIQYGLTYGRSIIADYMI